MKFVHAPSFPKKKTYSWWCMLGDFEFDELVAIKKALMPARRNLDRRVNFQFFAPADDVGETFTLSVLCMSDSRLALTNRSTSPSRRQTSEPRSETAGGPSL